MSKSRIFIFASVSFAGGVLVASRFDLPVGTALAGAVVLFSASLLCYRSPGKNRLFVILFSLACFSLGIWRLQFSLRHNEYANLLSQKVQLEGMIRQDIDRRPDRQQITFQPAGYQQNILLVTSIYGNYSYGDRILVSGKITEPKVSEDFDYRAFLQKSNIYGQMYYPKIIVLKTGQGNKVTQYLLKIKDLFIQQISVSLDSTKSNLLLGILIGAKKGLPEQVLDNFIATGTSHIIAISGYNISILIGALEILAWYLGRKINFWLTVAIVLAFVIISGGSASVIRAAGMGGLLLLAGRFGRLYAMTPALCLTALIMIVLNPRLLHWDVGFQLSFLATAGIVYGMPLLENLTESWPGVWGIKSVFLTTMAAIIATLPLILYQFGRLSIVAPVANILILPLIPATMLFGFLAGLPFIGLGFGFIASVLLSYVLWLTDRLAKFPFASTTVEISELTMVVAYLIMLVIYAIVRKLFLNRNSWYNI